MSKCFIKNKIGLNTIWIILSMIVITLVTIFAAMHNYGMGGDEVFSYISSTSMGGYKKVCYLKDQTWYDAQYFSNALTTTGSERFNIKMVFDNQAMDTHPPLFYVMLNLICSFFPGVFSRWFGIILNLAFMLGTDYVLYLLIDYFLKNRKLSLLLSTIFCCSSFAVYMVLFIRMYVMLMFFSVLQTLFHLKYYDYTENEENSTRKERCGKYVCLFVITFLGAMTHYYFLAFQFLISVTLIICLAVKKRRKSITRYMLSMILCAITYICCYPAAITHIFLKYRGRDAVHKFLKTNTFFDESVSMFRQFNNDTFRGTLGIIITLLIVLTVIGTIRKKVAVKVIGKGFILIMPLIIYFCCISKASPFVTERYISPVAALIYVFVIVWLFYVVDRCFTGLHKRITSVVLCAIIFMTTFYVGEPVKDNYFSEREQIINRLAKTTDYCVYISGDKFDWKMWEDYINYPQFNALYFIDGANMNPITDDKMLSQGKMVIYIDKALDLADTEHYLASYMPDLNYKTVYETNYTYIVDAEK